MSACQTLTVNQVRTGTCYINRKQNHLSAVRDIFQQKIRGIKKIGQLLSFNNCLPRIKMIQKIMTRSVKKVGIKIGNSGFHRGNSSSHPNLDHTGLQLYLI